MGIFSKFFRRETKALQLKGIKSNKKTDLRLESLEERQLLAVSAISPTGYSLMTELDNGNSSINNVNDVATLNFELDNAVSGAVLGFVVGASNGSALVPGKISIQNEQGTVVSLINQTSLNGNRSLSVANLAPGKYTIKVAGNGTTTGAFVCEVFLPGDRNGDGLVDQTEFAMVNDAIDIYETYLDPYITTFEQNRINAVAAKYGTTVSWFVSNIDSFDLDSNRRTEDNDYWNIARPNKLASDTAKSIGTTFDSLVSLNADNTGPVVTDPTDNGTVVVVQEFIGGAWQSVIYTTTPAQANYHVTDKSNLQSFVLTSATLPNGSTATNVDMTGAIQVIREADGTYSADISLEKILDAANGNGVAWQEGRYQFSVTITDEYGNATILSRTFDYRAAANISTIVVNTKSYDAYDLLGGEKTGVPSAVGANLNTYVSYTDNTALIYYNTTASDNRLHFRSQTGGTLYWYDTSDSTWKTTTAVSYVLQVDGSGGFTVAIDQASFSAWLSTLGTAPSALNNIILRVPFEVASVYNKNLENDASNTYWYSGYVSVKLTPANDTPTAVVDAYTVAESVTGETSAVEHVLANDTDPDRWETFSLIGIEISGVVKYFATDATGTISGGKFDGCKYIEITVPTQNGETGKVWLIQYTEAGTATTADHTTTNKIAVDLRDSFNYLGGSETATFTFKYVMNDAAGATSAAVVTMTVQGVNDPPVVEDATISTNENTLSSVVPVVNDPDEDDTYTLHIKTTATPTWTYSGGSSGANYNNIKAKVDLLDLLDFVVVTGTNQHTLTFDPMSYGGTSYFDFLAYGESLTLVYTFYATDAAGAASNDGTLTITLHGANNTPAITGWDAGAVSAGVTPLTITLASTSVADVDVNDAHIFYQVYGKTNVMGDAGWQMITITPVYVYNAQGKLMGYVVAGSNGTTVLYYPTSDHTKWELSDQTGYTFEDFAIQFKAIDSSNIVTPAPGATDETGVSAAFSVLVKVNGVYDQPEIPAGQTPTLSVTVDDQPASPDLVGHVDAGYTSTWTLNTAVITGGAFDGTDVLSYFTLTNGVLDFASNALRHQFESLFMSSSVTSVGVALSVSVSDGTNSDTETVSLTVQSKQPPVVTIKDGVTTETINGKTVVISGSTANENQTANLSTTLSNFYTVVDPEEDPENPRPANWFSYKAISFEKGMSSVTNGSTTTSMNAVHAGSIFQAGDYTLTQDVNGNFVMTIQRTALDKVFRFLAVGDHAKLIFSAQVTDGEFGCFTTVYFAVEVVGENDSPYFTTSSVTSFIDINDTNVGNLKNSAALSDFAADYDWSDSITVIEKTFTGGYIGGIAKNTAEIAAYFGMTEAELLASLVYSNVTGNFTFTYNNKFLVLPEGVAAELTFTFKVQDNSGAANNTSVTFLAVPVVIHGTNQAPSGLADKETSVDLRSATINPTYDLRTGATDIDTGETTTLVGWLDSGPVIEVGGVVNTELDVNGAITVDANGIITIDIAKLTAGFEKLVVGQTATITWGYKVKDIHDAEAVEGVKSFTITVTGKNEAPTATAPADLAVTMLANAAADNTAIDITAWFAGTDPDTIPGANADTLSLYSIAGQVVTKPASGPQTIFIYDHSSVLMGKVVVTWSGSNIDSVWYFPIANDGTTSSEDTFKWNLDTSVTKDVFISFVMQDNHGALAPEVTGTVAVTGVRDDLVLTSPASTDVYMQGKVVNIAGVDYVAISGAFTFKKESTATYTFDITDVVLESGVGALVVADFRVEANLNTAHTAGSLTIYIKKDSLIAETEHNVYTVTLAYEEPGQITRDFEMTIKSKSAPTLNPVTKDLGSVQEQSTNPVTWDIFSGLVVKDTDTGETADSFTVANSGSAGLELVGVTGSYTLSQLNTAGIVSNIEKLASLASGVFTFANQIDVVNTRSKIFEFLLGAEGANPAQTLTLTFKYTVDSYTIDDITYYIGADGYITITLVGENNAPVASNNPVAGSIDGDLVSQSFPIDTLLPAGTVYDVDGDLAIASNLRISDIDRTKLVVSGYTELGVPTELTLVAGDSQRVYLSSTTGSPYVMLVNDAGTIKLNVYLNGKYVYLPIGQTANLTINFKVVDKYGTGTASNAAALTMTVVGKYQAPEKIADISNQIGSIEGATNTITLDMADYFKFTAGTVTWSLTVPTSASKVLKGYQFIGNTLVLTFLPKAEYLANLDLSDLNGLIVTATDGQSNAAVSNAFNLVLAEKTTVEILLHGTTTFKTETGTPRLPGTQITETGSGITTRARYITSAVFDQYNSTSTDIGVDSHGGYYVEVWIRDDLAKLYGTSLGSGIQFVQMLLHYNGDAVNYIVSPDESYLDPNGDEDNGYTSIGWGVTSNGTTKPDYFWDVRDAVTGNSCSAFYLGFLSQYGTAANGTNVPVNGAYLFARFYVYMNSGYDPKDANFTVTGIDSTKWIVYSQGSPITGLAQGYAYARINDAEARLTVDESQIASYYKTYTYTWIHGATVAEEVVDGGLYIRTATEPTKDSIVTTLSTNADYLNEWQTHYAELWVKLSDADLTTGATITFKYNPEFFAPSAVQFSSLFAGNYVIDYANGTITIDAQAAASFVNGTGYALIAQVTFKALDVQYTVEGQVLSTNIKGISAKDATKPFSLGWALLDGHVHYLKTGEAKSYLGKTSSTELWAMPYDLNDDGSVNALDALEFFQLWNQSYVNEGYLTYFDFNQDGNLNALDMLDFFGMYNLSKQSVANGAAVKFPMAFTQRYVGSTLQTANDVKMVGVLLDAANEAWKNALGLENAVDVQLVVRNLGGEQLAKAVITAYDANGLPTAGVIYLDDDAAGSTWLAQLSGNIADSSKYDLYTVLLHELGHLYGYDSSLQAFTSVAGQFGFIEDGHSNIGSDMMSDVLTTGQRKTLSVNDVYVLALMYQSLNPNYVVPEAVMQAWNASQGAAAALPGQDDIELLLTALLPTELVADRPMETSELFVAAALPVGVAAVLSSDTLLASNASVDQALEINTTMMTVSRATMVQLNSLGLNVPNVAIVEDQESMTDTSLQEIFADEEKSESTFFLPEDIAKGAQAGYETSLDIVINNYLT